MENEPEVKVDWFKVVVWILVIVACAVFWVGIAEVVTGTFHWIGFWK